MKRQIVCLGVLTIVAIMLLAPAVSAKTPDVVESNGACVISVKASSETIKIIHHDHGAMKILWHQPEIQRHIIITSIDKKGDFSFDLIITVTHDGKEHAIVKEIPIQEADGYVPMIQIGGITVWYASSKSGCTTMVVIGIEDEFGNGGYVQIWDYCGDGRPDELWYSIYIWYFHTSGKIQLPHLR